MKSFPTTPRERGREAFSLIEVVLAVAITALGLLAILGLLPQGLVASRNAADNTISATLAHDTFNAIRTNSFSSVDLRDLGFTQPAPTLNLNIFNNVGSIPLAVSAYFDKAGFSFPAFQDRYYRVNLTFQPQTPLALSTVTATIVWPALSAAPANTNIFYTQVAAHDL